MGCEGDQILSKEFKDELIYNLIWVGATVSQSLPYKTLLDIWALMWHFSSDEGIKVNGVVGVAVVYAMPKMDLMV